MLSNAALAWPRPGLSIGFPRHWWLGACAIALHILHVTLPYVWAPSIWQSICQVNCPNAIPLHADLQHMLLFRMQVWFVLDIVANHRPGSSWSIGMQCMMPYRASWQSFFSHLGPCSHSADGSVQLCKVLYEKLSEVVSWEEQRLWKRTQNAQQDQFLKMEFASIWRINISAWIKSKDEEVNRELSYEPQSLWDLKVLLWAESKAQTADLI